MRHTIYKRQILYMNQVLWSMQGSVTWKAVMEEWRRNGFDSMVENIDRVAVMYGLEKVSRGKLDKKHVKFMIRNYSDKELWRENYASSIIQSRPMLRISNFSHFGWPRSKSRALFFWYTRALKFKTQWKVYNIQKGIGVNCVFPLCPGFDELLHVKVCMF